MSGKAYTMTEMRGIVEYLVEHKSFSEIKGRKMWMDFANSRLTNRSWQSLKETFLKRILPDIHNPYYKLTMDQIQSFRQGIDVQERERNKLEIRAISDDSGSNAQNPKGNEHPSTSKLCGVEKTSGEDIPSRISSRNRSSVDTVILENCYETADDVLRDLESTNDATDDVSKSQNKSLRDLITYSEPLTPMLQEVLHDFATDDDSDSGEPQMQIVENVLESEEQGKKSPRNLTDTVKQTSETNTEKNNQNDLNESQNFTEPKVKSLRLRKRQGIYVPVSDQTPSNNPDAVKTSNCSNQKTNNNQTEINNVSEPLVNLSNDKTIDKLTKSNVQSTQNCSSSTTDTVLPNNQEALDKNLDDSKKETNNITETNSNGVNNVARKRVASHDMHDLQNKTTESKSRISTSDTDVGKRKSNSNNVTDAKCNEAGSDHSKDTRVTRDENVKSCEIDTQDILPPNKTKDVNTSTQSSQINPCLQSVSLFAEQFNQSNNLDSESSYDGEPSNQAKQSVEKLDTIENPTKDKTNEVVVLKSYSESESDTTKEPVKKNDNNKKTKSKRDKALANAFGFSSGAVTSKRKKYLSLQKSSTAHHFNGHNSSLESSEWTSESDSDYVSPPRGRRNRRSSKYLKPKSAHIHSLEHEGGLFVIYGKKVYPLVKDGRTIKNYLVYSPDSDPEEEENYWKQKYVEERKRVEELKTFIKQTKKENSKNPSPVLSLKSPRKQTVPQDYATSAKSISISDDEQEVVAKEVPKEEVQKKEPIVETKNKTLKITFAKNNQEVHLEGHWSQLHPVLADVVEIFHKDSSKEPPIKKSEQNLPIEVVRDKSPITLSPLDPVVHEKVNKLETEIFNEIEERHQDEQAEGEDEIESNVTKRKRPNRVTSTSIDVSNTPDPSSESSRSSKRAKTTKKTEEEVNAVVEDKKQASDVEKGIDTPIVEKTSSKGKVTPRKKNPKQEPKNRETEEVAAPSENRTRVRKNKLAISEETKATEDDSEVRYMFPPTKKPTKSSTSVGNTNQPTKRYSINIRSIFSPSGSSQHSESTQGYQDSDTSPTKLKYKKKRRLSLSTVVSKTKNKHIRMKKRSHPIICDDRSSDSINSYHIIFNPASDNGSLKSDDYRSESYRILMSNRNNVFKPLEKIDEHSSLFNNNFDKRNLNIPSESENVKNKIHNNITNDSSLSSNSNIDAANSSSLSLPLSPELSIVENLSVSKELIHRISNQTTLIEIDINDTTKSVAQNKYLISQVDVTMPLMQQECDVHRSYDSNLRSDCSPTEMKKPIVTETLLNKINAVNIKETPSLSDSLDTRLKNLLLESAKKMSKTDEDNNDNPMPNNEETTKKIRSKRCSTPRKKKDAQATKVTKTRKGEPVIEEECMESCSYRGRQSCPPSIHIINDGDIYSEILDKMTTDKKTSSKEKTKERRKKDIIKVKITRPSKNNKKTKNTPKKADKSNRASMMTNNEANENESGISSQELSDAIDLIHNHSETCLQANECIGDSVEFLEMTAKSIISVHSNSTASCDCKEPLQGGFHNCADISSLLCNNAQYNITPYKAKENLKSNTTSDTVYHSPSNMSLTSLITEDLSDENPQSTQSTKWYLFSEDETNTNIGPQNQNSFGTNLKQLFPLTCAVPDLSTITEISKENNDNSRKLTEGSMNYDKKIENDVNSQSVLDMN